MSREYEYHWSWSLPAPPEALWPLASDTNRFKRDVGLPAVEELEPEDGPAPNARRRLRVKGMTLEWEKLPFGWVRPRRFGVVRPYSRPRTRSYGTRTPTTPASASSPPARSSSPST